MTVAAVTPFIQYAGNGSTTVFPVPFKFLASADLSVTRTDTSGNVVQLTEGVDYTVSGAGNDAGGSITMGVAPPSGYGLTIRRNTAQTQSTDFVDANAFLPAIHETAFDRATMLVQDLAQNLSDTKSDLESQISEGAGGLVNDTYLDIGNNPAAALSSAGRMRMRLNGAVDQVSTNGGIYKSFVPTHFDVRDYGAVGDGVTDDTAAIQSAISAAQAAGGGTLFLPKPSVCYRVTSQLLIGSKWVSEADCTYAYTYNLTSAPSYNGTLANAAYALPLISIRADMGTEIWGDFAPGTETAILYYGARGQDVPGTPCAIIEGLTFTGRAGFSGGARVVPSTSTPTTSNLVGIFLASTRVNVDRCYARELHRGFASTDSYWTSITKCQADHCIKGFEVIGANAQELRRNVSKYCTYGLIFAGANVSVARFDSEECVSDIWAPLVDGCHIDGYYLESTGTSQTGYALQFGDTANPSNNQCQFCIVTNGHGDKQYGQELHLVAAQVVTSGVRHYPRSPGKTLVDVNSGIAAFQTSLTIDGSSTGFVLKQDSHGIVAPYVEVTGKSYYGVTAATGGLKFPNVSIWQDGAYNFLRAKGSTPTLDSDGQALTWTSVKKTITPSAIASGGKATFDIPVAGGVVPGDVCRASHHDATSALVAEGVLFDARCLTADSIRVTVVNMSGSSWGNGTLTADIDVAFISGTQKF